MVAPSALAETVTPPIFSPAVDVMVPARSASAQAALEARVPTAMAITLAPASCRAVFMAFLRGRFVRKLSRAGGGRHRERLVAHRQGPHIGRNGGDLVGAVGILEGWHARRAIGDDRADRLLAAAGAVLVELRPIEAGDQRRPGVADAAGGLVEPPAELLLLVEL